MRFEAGRKASFIPAVGAHSRNFSAKESAIECFDGEYVHLILQRLL